MKMRVFLAVLYLFHSTYGSEVGINVPCNKELDGLLAADPDGNESAFMSCVGVGVGNIGFWERKICPNEMVFDFINQQCKTKTKKARKQQTLNIAILNNSCANGETCIGGSVCDLDSLKCMCPYGTIPQLDTLSCESNEPTFVSAPIDAPTFSFNSFGSVEKSPPNNGGFMPNNFNMPSQNSGGFQPNPTFKFNNFNTNTNNNNNRFNNFGATGNMNSNSNNNFQWKPEFSFKPNWNNVVNNNNNGQSSFNSFQPNTPQKFVFNANNNNNNNNNAYIQPVSVQKKISTLARPGDSCRSNEVCVGGSICTLPIGLCLCPGDLEERDGECVLPAASSIKISKVGIGALCSELAECDHGSSCVMGRCACLSPLVQHEGKCVLRQQQKQVGPGELCDNGEVCVKGSVCDAVIPVCVCPSETDLNDGECVRIASATKPTPVVPQVTQAPYRPPQPPQPVFTAPPTQKTAAPIMTMPPQPPQTQAPFTYYPQTAAPHTLPPATYKTTPRPQPPVFVTSRPETTPAPVVNYKNIYTGAPSKPSTSKPNHMKISLGGSKQAGVGVRCSLNTDCMIGAYCNGNTNPPSCQCLSTHVNIDGRCEKANEPVTSPPGGSCSGARECTGGSVCKEGWCICPDPSMIVNKGICVQSGPKPTLPPKNSMTFAPQTSAPIYQSATTMNIVPTYRPTVKPVPVSNYQQPQKPIVPSTQGRKTVPGSQCGPLDVCVGGSQCIDGLCLCPAGTIPSQNGRCEKPTTTATRPLTHAQPPAVTQGATVFARPLGDCSLGQICTGGSQCSQRSICECPSEKPELRNGECSAPIQKVEAGPGESCDETKTCTRGSNCVSGQCRCQPGYIAISGSCVTLPMPTTPKMVVYAKPLESCDNGEICEGGASCDDDTGICMCPRGQVVFGTQCMPPPTQPQTSAASTTRAHPPVPVITPAPSVYSTECETDANCGDNKMCMMGRCKCKAGFVDNNGQCEPLEAIDAVERPVPVSYAKHKVETLSSERIHAREEEEEEEEKETTTRRATTRAPARQETQKPRIVGPPIRRPKPKNKGGSGGGTPTGNRGSGSYKTGGTGNGNCPPGNDPTRDDSGRLITCNGLEPNCPPRSYCYITSGGFATEEYNCCKSW